jgi:hypothetical protein
MNTLQKIIELYKSIGLDENGEPFDRPPKRYPTEKPKNDGYGYSTNNTFPVERPIAKNEHYCVYKLINEPFDFLIIVEKELYPFDLFGLLDEIKRTISTKETRLLFDFGSNNGEEKKSYFYCNSNLDESCSQLHIQDRRNSRNIQLLLVNEVSENIKYISKKHRC